MEAPLGLQCPFSSSSLYVFGIMLSYFEQIETGLTWENVRTNIIEENGLGHVSCSSLMYVISSSILLFGLGVLVDDLVESPACGSGAGVISLP